MVDTCFDNSLSEDESYSLENLISGIKEVQSPVVTEDYIIFTANKNARFTGTYLDAVYFLQLFTQNIFQKNIGSFTSTHL